MIDECSEGGCEKVEMEQKRVFILKEESQRRSVSKWGGDWEIVVFCMLGKEGRKEDDCVKS